MATEPEHVPLLKDLCNRVISLQNLAVEITSRQQLERDGILNNWQHEIRKLREDVAPIMQLAILINAFITNGAFQKILSEIFSNQADTTDGIHRVAGMISVRLREDRLLRRAEMKKPAPPKKPVKKKVKSKR